MDKCFLQICKYLQYKRSWFLRHENLLSSVGGFALRISPDFEIKPTQSLLQIVSNCWCLLILMAEQSSRKKQLHRQFNFRDLFQENLRSEIVSNLSIHTPRGFLPGRFSGFLRSPFDLRCGNLAKSDIGIGQHFCINLQQKFVRQCRMPSDSSRLSCHQALVDVLNSPYHLSNPSYRMHHWETSSPVITPTHVPKPHWSRSYCPEFTVDLSEL